MFSRRKVTGFSLREKLCEAPANYWKLPEPGCAVYETIPTYRKWHTYLIAFCFSWITTITTILCWKHLLYTGVLGGRSTHTHRVNFYPQEASIVQPFQDKSRPSAVFYLSPQYLENSYPPREISLVQQNILLIWAIRHHSHLNCTYDRNSAGAVCLFSPPADFSFFFLQNISILPLLPCLY